MTDAITIVWTLSIVLVVISALLLAVENIDVIVPKAAASWNKLIDALLELEE